MSNNVFPKDGSIDLAVEKLANAIEENKLDEKEIDYLTLQFGFFSQKDEFTSAKKILLKNFSREQIKNSLKEGLKANHDFLLDMQYSEQLVPVPKTYYNSDICTKKAEENLKNIGFFKNDELYLFLHIDTSCKNSVVGKDFANLKNIEDVNKLMLSRVIHWDKTKYTIDITHKKNTPYFEATLYKCGKSTEQHFYLMPESQWDRLKGYNKETNNYERKYFYTFFKKAMQNSYVKEVIKSHKIIENLKQESEKNSVAKKAKDIYQEYFRKYIDMLRHPIIIDAWNKVSRELAYDVITKSKTSLEINENYNKCEEVLVKFNPTETDKNDIIAEFKNNCRNVKGFLHSQQVLRELGHEAENNPTAAKMQEVYQAYMDEWDITAENFKNRTNEKAWEKVSYELARKLITDSKMTLKDRENYNKCEALLTKFNPTLRPADEIIKDFKSDCQEMIKYHEHREAKAKQKQR